jgi:ABC-2 type transport system permease protein
VIGFFRIIKAEIVRGFIIMRRYWFATLIGMAMGYTTLIGMVYVLTMHTPDSVRQFADKSIGTILGFLVGIFAFGIVGMFSQGLQGMARTGELEQVCLSPYGLVMNFLGRSFVSALSSIINSTIMLVLVAATVSQHLHIAPFETLALLGLTYINLIGFGFMVGGLVLVFKQTGQIAMIVRFVMMGLAVIATDASVSGWPFLLRMFAHMMPITDAVICLKYTLIDGQANGSVFLQESFFFLLVSCVVWTSVGIFLFRLMEDWSRDKGTLGAY